MPLTTESETTTAMELTTESDTEKWCPCDKTTTSSVTSTTTSTVTSTEPERQTTEITEEELDEKLETIRKKLTIDRTILSSTIRKRESASDDRMSAKGIGIVGVIILCTVMGLIALMDVPVIVTSLLMAWRSVFRKRSVGCGRH